MGLNYTSYPHIVDEIFAYVLADHPITLRGVCRTTKAAADAALCKHIAVDFRTVAIRHTIRPTKKSLANLAYPLNYAPERDVPARMRVDALYANSPQSPWGCCRVPGLRLRLRETAKERAECVRLLRFVKTVDIFTPRDYGKHYWPDSPLAPFLDGDLLQAIGEGLECIRATAYPLPVSAPTLVLHGPMSYRARWVDPAHRLPLPYTLVLNVQFEDIRGDCDAVRLPLQTKLGGSPLRRVIAHVHGNFDHRPRHGAAFGRVVTHLIRVVAETLTLDWTIVVDCSHPRRNSSWLDTRNFTLRRKIWQEIRYIVTNEDPVYDPEMDWKFISETVRNVKILSSREYRQEVGKERYWFERGWFATAVGEAVDADEESAVEDEI